MFSRMTALVNGWDDKGAGEGVAYGIAIPF